MPVRKPKPEKQPEKPKVPRIVQWNNSSGPDSRGVFITLNRDDAISLATSILAQMDVNSANSHRIEFTNAELHVKGKIHNTYLSVGVWPEENKQTNRNSILPFRVR